MVVEDYQFVIGYGYDLEEAKGFRDDLVNAINEAHGDVIKSEDIELRKIGAAIGVHVGPHALGIAIVCKYDSESAEKL